MDGSRLRGGRHATASSATQDAGALRGRRQGWLAGTPPRAVRPDMQAPCAGGGRGRPRPLHSRPGAAPLGTPIWCLGMGSAWCACLRAEWSRQLI